IAPMVDPYRRGDRQLYLYLGDGWRQCRLHRYGLCPAGGPAVNPFSLAGQVALVTGANTGIGQAIAVAMAQAGAEVIAAGRSDCDETLALLGGGRRMRLDFGDPMAARDVFARERIDILVNNAGIIRRADAVDFTEADWDAVIDVNLKALF